MGTDMENKDRDREEQEQMDWYFYLAGWIFLALGALFWFLYRYTSVPVSRYLGRCLFHELTGFYCPGCGGTRAFLALCQGRILKSLIYHPIVLYGVIVGGTFMVSQTLYRAGRKKFPLRMHFHPGWILAGVVLVLVNFVVKNALLYFWGIALLG